MKDDAHKQPKRSESGNPAEVTRLDADATDLDGPTTFEPKKSEATPDPASISTTRPIRNEEAEKPATKIATHTTPATGALPKQASVETGSTAVPRPPAASVELGAPELIKELHTPPGIKGDPGLVADRVIGQGRFTLIRQLGRGGMGVVWLARDGRLREEVALKLLPPEVAADPTAISDLGVETQKSRRLTHPHIIRIHDLYESENEPVFISMECVNGPNLTSLRLKQEHRCFTWEFIRPLMIQLCEALDYAHGEKVIHRDLKPSNVMLDSRGRLKLADFGIAATVSDSMSRVSRRDTSGTLVYMSPQQMDGDTPRPTDDIYALGCTIYELLSSKPPFYTGNIEYQVHSVPAKLVTDRIAEYEIDNPVPDTIVDLIAACLAKDPKQRPQHASVVMEWIKNGAPPDTEENPSDLGAAVTPPPSNIPAASGPGTSKPRTGTARGTSKPEAATTAGTRVPTTREAQTGLGAGTTHRTTKRTAQVPSQNNELLEELETEPAAPTPPSNSRFLVPILGVAIVIIIGLVWLLYSHSHKSITNQSPPVATTEPAPPPVTPNNPAPAQSPTVAKQPVTPPPVEHPQAKVETPPPVVVETPAPVEKPAPPPEKPKSTFSSYFAPSYPKPDSEYVNSLGVKFVPVPGTQVLFSTYDTRVQDYQKFVAVTKRAWPATSFTQEPTHPAVNILWDDATAFCKWLTEKERSEKKISSSQRYRLPTDAEWSTAVGLGSETGNTPSEKDGKITNSFPWGTVARPDTGVANLGRALKVDEFDHTSPVGNFSPNQFGLYDMGGNVRQWCNDAFDNGGQSHFLRGSSWTTVWTVSLLSSSRVEGSSDTPSEFNGFRCVLDFAAPN